MSNKTSEKETKELVKVEVSSLKNRLNHLYQTRKDNRAILSHDGLFEYLWDLKELALIEGKSSVEVPSSWLEELDTSFNISQQTQLKS